MVYSYTPTYYSTLHDSITQLCKNLLPFGFKRRRLPPSDHRLSRLQSENLKWQQDSYHQMLNLMGLHKEGILAHSEVSAFSTHLLQTLIASPPEQDHPLILRDKLLFLQELLYASCISEEEYHASKRPLIQRLAVQGAEIEATEVIVAGSRDPKENSLEQEWSVIDLKGEQCLINKENSNSKNTSKIKAASIFSFSSSRKARKNMIEKSIFDSPSLHLNSAPSKFTAKNEFGYSQENPFWNGESKSQKSGDKLKRKPFRTLFLREQREGPSGPEAEERVERSAKKQWDFDGIKKWKNNDSDDETAPLPLNERSDIKSYLASSQLVTKFQEEEPDTTKMMKKKLHSDGSPSDFFVDKVSGEKIQKEPPRIRTDQNTNPNKFSSRCDRYGDAVLGMKKESKNNVGEMENMCNGNAREKHSYSLEWTTFEDDENFHPNLFALHDRSCRSSSINPFAQ